MSYDFIIEKPKSWDLFEDWICDLARLEFQNPNFYRYGKSGQEQKGVDIFGISTSGALGIQCKKNEHQLTPAEIKEIMEKAHSFRPKLDVLIIATSSDRNVNASDVINQANIDKINPFETQIWLWDDISDKLKKHPRLLLSYLKFDYSNLGKIINSQIFSVPARDSISWPCTQDELEEKCKLAMNNPVDSNYRYVVSIGISNYKSRKTSIPLDLEMELSNDVQELSDTDYFLKTYENFKSLRNMLDFSFFDSKIVFDNHLFLPIAFLLGYVFRKAKSWNPVLIQGEMAWPATGLEMVNPGINIHMPIVINSKSKEIAISLGISREIKKKVLNCVTTMESPPRFLINYSYDGKISNSAQPMTIGLEFAKIINTLIDEEEIKRIHLFLAIPQSLSTILGFNLNQICPIDLYYLDGDRQTYKLAGTVTKDM